MNRCSGKKNKEHIVALETIEFGFPLLRYAQCVPETSAEFRPHPTRTLIRERFDQFQQLTRIFHSE
ncbi:MAG: hypothetical protein ACRET5_16980, partial [Steroidobacteraceae bacterium]